MYLRQTNKWKEFALQEGIEDIGLPPEVANYLRRQNQTFGPVSNKFLTWLGTLIKAVRSGRFFEVADYKTIIEDIVGLSAFPSTPDGEKAWSKSLEFFKNWYINHSGTRGAPTIMDVKGLKKSARKLLKKLNAPDEAIKQLEAYLDYRMLRGTQALQQLYSPIIKLLAEDPAYYDELREEIFAARKSPSDALRVASDIARDVLASPVKAEDQVIHTFDNDYFWYDIRSHACDFEGKKMGHCGRGDQGQLYSLRSGEGRRNIKPMITLEFADGVVYQIKAKANKAPTQDMWPYIDWFIENMGVEMVDEKGLHSSDGIGFAEMLEYLKQKHPDVKFEDSWITKATELIDMEASSFAFDSQTDQEVEYPSMGSLTVSFMVKHQAFWPVKDVVVDEANPHDLSVVRNAARRSARLALNPRPQIRDVSIFPRGVQDSKSAMIRVELEWVESFEPEDIDYQEDVAEELARLSNYLDEMREVSAYLVSDEAAPEEAEFDYNGFWEGVQAVLESYGVYRDVAAEEDRQLKRDQEEAAGQQRLPLQESEVFESWAKIIK